MTVYVCVFIFNVYVRIHDFVLEESAREIESEGVLMNFHTVSLSSFSPDRTCTISRHTDKPQSAKLLRKLGTQLSHLGMIANTCTIIVTSTDCGGRRMVRCRSGNLASGLLRLESQIQVCRGVVKLMCGSCCINSNL